MNDIIRRFPGQEQDVINPFHPQRAAQVAADVERFLAKGGQVTEVPAGVSGAEPVDDPLDAVKKRDFAKRQNAAAIRKSAHNLSQRHRRAAKKAEREGGDV